MKTRKCPLCKAQISVRWSPTKKRPGRFKLIEHSRALNRSVPQLLTECKMSGHVVISKASAKYIRDYELEKVMEVMSK